MRNNKDSRGELRQSPRVSSLERLRDHTYRNRQTLPTAYNTQVRSSRDNRLMGDGDGAGTTRSGAKRSFRQMSRVRLGAIMIMIIVVSVMLYGATLKSEPAISIVGSDDYYTINGQGRFAGPITKILSDDWTNGNKLTMNTLAIETQIKQQFPELREVDVQLPIVGRTPKVFLQLRQPVATLLASDGSAYVVDSDGIVIGNASDLNSEYRSKLPALVDKASIDLDLGVRVLAKESIRFINEIIYQLTAKDMQASKIVLPVGLYEVDVHIDGIGYYVKTDTSGDSRLQMGGFFAVKADLESKGISPAEYIDVRVEEKVFYK